MATAYNNYGVALGHQGKWEQAVQQLQEALRVDADNAQFKTNLSTLYLNQAHTAYQQHQLRDAKTSVERAMALDPPAHPTMAQAYALLGHIEYDSQRLKEAQAAWQQSLELDPHQSDLQQQLQQVTQELPIESKFERLSQAYFELRYEEQLERSVGFDIRDALLEARRAVGSDFAYWPQHKVLVLIYSATTFRALRHHTPDWVAGQFDGKIRLPLPDNQFNSATVQQIVFHEYTHAVVQDLTKGQCPTWLNEGLAEYEGRTQWSPPLLQLRSAIQANRLMPWAELSNQFSASLATDAVALGYEQAYAVVAYLIERYGFWRMRRVLKALDQGTAWEPALENELRLKLPRLEANWRNWLPDWLARTPSQ